MSRWECVGSDLVNLEKIYEDFPHIRADSLTCTLDKFKRSVEDLINNMIRIPRLGDAWNHNSTDKHYSAYHDFIFGIINPIRHKQRS